MRVAEQGIAEGTGATAGGGRTTAAGITGRRTASGRSAACPATEPTDDGRRAGAFILIMVGFLLQWPTVLTLIMFPILVAMYVRLAHREEREARAEFEEAYARYAATTPAFVPGCETRNEVAEDVEMALERRMAKAAR